MLEVLAKETEDKNARREDSDKKFVALRGRRELLQEAHEEDIENLKLIAKKLRYPEYSAAALATTHEYQKVKELEAQVKEEEAARVQAEEEKRRLEEELKIERQKNT